MKKVNLTDIYNRVHSIGSLKEGDSIMVSQEQYKNGGFESVLRACHVHAIRIKSSVITIIHEDGYIELYFKKLSMVQLISFDGFEFSHN